jgi:hypothetical protein
MRVLTDVTGEQLRTWREARGWDVPRMARELRKLDIHIAEVEASVAVLKALLADGEVPGEEDPADPKLR